MADAAPTRKLCFTNLTADCCNEATLIPLLSNGGKLSLLRLVISAERRCAVATYGSRLDALRAKHSLDGKPPRDLTVAWALRVGTLRITDVSPEVSREDLNAALSAHGVVEAVEIDRDAAGRPNGSATVCFRSRAAAARVLKMCAVNMLILAGSVVPLRVAIADGAADDDYGEGEALTSGDEPPSTLGRDLLRGEEGDGATDFMKNITTMVNDQCWRDTFQLVVPMLEMADLEPFLAVHD